MAEETGDYPVRLRFPREGETDPVTGLPPRKALDEDLPRLLRLMAVERLPLSAVMIDIDHFKLFNDRWGHSIGDMVLLHVSRIIRESVRYRGEAYRYGGEEITVLLPNFDRSEGLAAASRMVSTVGHSPLSIPADDPSIPVSARVQAPGDSSGTVSLGVEISAGVCSTLDVTGAELIVMADKALYEAKESGRNRAVEFTPRLNSESRTFKIGVTYFGKSPIFDRNRLIIKAWFPKPDAQEIEAREITFLDSIVSEPLSLASPPGGLINQEIPGRVVFVENRGNYTWFEFEIREEVFELMWSQVRNRNASGGSA
ncbi:MAG: GGDEF domain-containing protein [Candidatus Fermentibacter sp.]|nr:GGDEF domain-containing protein [Candidatus Fermentibacter sp.]